MKLQLVILLSLCEPSLATIAYNNLNDVLFFSFFFLFFTDQMGELDARYKHAKDKCRDEIFGYHCTNHGFSSWFFPRPSPRYKQKEGKHLSLSPSGKRRTIFDSCIILSNTFNPVSYFRFFPVYVLTLQCVITDDLNAT